MFLRSLEVTTPSYQVKAEQTEKPTLFKSVREVKSQSKPPPLTLERRQTERSTPNQSRNPYGNQGWGRETQTVLDQLGAQCRQVGELKKKLQTQSSGASHFCKFYLQKLYQVPTVSIREKFPVLLAEGGKGGHSEVYQDTSEICSYEGLKSGELSQRDPSLRAFMRA